MDIETVVNEVTNRGALELSRDELVAEASAIAIADDAQYKVAGGLRKQLADLRGEILLSTQPVVKAAHAAHKAAKNQENELVNPIKEAESRLGRTMGAYVQKQEAAQREAERAARAKHEAEEDAALDKAQAMQDKGQHEEAAAVMEAVPRVAPAVKQVAAPKLAGTRRTENWKFEIVDPNLLPVDFLIPDVKTIGEVVRRAKGETKIPGVRVWSETKVSA